MELGPQWLDDFAQRAGWASLSDLIRPIMAVTAGHDASIDALAEPIQPGDTPARTPRFIPIVVTVNL
jgi:hypothetical protein